MRTLPGHTSMRPALLTPPAALLLRHLLPLLLLAAALLTVGCDAEVYQDCDLGSFRVSEPSVRY